MELSRPVLRDAISNIRWANLDDTFSHLSLPSTSLTPSNHTLWWNTLSISLSNLLQVTDPILSNLIHLCILLLHIPKYCASNRTTINICHKNELQTRLFLDQFWSAIPVFWGPLPIYWILILPLSFPSFLNLSTPELPNVTEKSENFIYWVSNKFTQLGPSHPWAWKSLFISSWCLIASLWGAEPCRI